RFQQPGRFGGQGLHILSVFDNRNPFAMLMSRNAVQALQHLVAFDKEPALPHVIVRQNRAPYRVRVQDGAGPPAADNGRVQKSLGGWFSGVGIEDTSLGIDFQYVFELEIPFVERAGRDRDPKRIFTDDCAEVAACPKYPPAPMEV